MDTILIIIKRNTLSSMKLSRRLKKQNRKAYVDWTKRVDEGRPVWRQAMGKNFWKIPPPPRHKEGGKINGNWRKKQNLTKDWFKQIKLREHSDNEKREKEEKDEDMMKTIFLLKFQAYDPKTDRLDEFHNILLTLKIYRLICQGNYCYIEMVP